MRLLLRPILSNSETSGYLKKVVVNVVGVSMGSFLTLVVVLEGFCVINGKKKASDNTMYLLSVLGN